MLARNWRVVAVLSVGMLLAVAALAVHFWQFWRSRFEDVPVTSLSEVSRISGVSFPSGSSLRTAVVRRTWPAHELLFAQVTIPSGEVDAFKKSAISDAHIGFSSDEIPFAGGSVSPEWWPPKGTEATVAVHRIGDGFRVHIAIADEVGTATMAYVVWERSGI